MAHQLPELPYPKNALAPYFSEETLNYHYGKHHQAYVTNLNKLVEATDLADKNLGQLIKTTDGAVFNNAAQVFNHTFYWHSLNPKGGGEPSGRFADALIKQFGSIEKFKDEFTQKALGLFGSGWCWLVKNEHGQMEIVQTFNAGCPITVGKEPLLTCDLWEHAYYVDYRNARAKYIEAFWALVNWDFAAQNF